MSIVILTALPVEQVAVVAAVGNGVDRRRDGHPFHEGQVAGRRVRVVPTGGPGHAHAAEAARRAVDVWNPDRILFVGIAGGARSGGELRLGDVLVPDQVLGYELDGPRNRWEAYRPAPDLLEAARHVPPGDWRGEATGPAVHFGTVLSGEKVLARGPIVARLRRGWPRTIGVEMGALGTALASYRGGPGFLVVKAVSGFAGGTVRSARSAAGHAGGATGPGGSAARSTEGTADPTGSAARSTGSGADPTGGGAGLACGGAGLAGGGAVEDWQRDAAGAAARFAVAVLRREPGRSDAGRPQAVPAGGPTRFSGSLRILVCRRLGDDWYDLADWFDIRPYETARFTPGKEPRDVWEWLERKDKLHALSAALRAIGRDDLARPLEQGDPDT